MTRAPNPVDWPTVTVLVPCRNEAGFIRRALESILANDYPPERVEILVLDGMSTDGTREIVRDLRAEHARIRLVDNPDLIVPTALNRGIDEARGEYLVRIDGHARFAEDYLRRCIEVSRRTGAANVGGYWRTLPGADTPTARAIVLATTSRFGIGGAAFRLAGETEREVETVPFGTFRRDLFDQVGRFDERLVRNQDIEMNARLRRRGLRVVISPAIRLSYFNRATLAGLWQQSFNNGRWNPYTVWLTGGSLQLRHFIPLTFLTALLATLIGSVFLPLLGAAFIGLAGVYLVCSVVFALGRRPRTAGTSVLRVAAAFWTLHVAYGLGTLWGVITLPLKFPRRGGGQVGRALPDRRP